VVDTAQALQIREASRLIEHGLVRFGEVLESAARTSFSTRRRSAARTACTPSRSPSA
jgi:adenylosuccinate lyase